MIKRLFIFIALAATTLAAGAVDLKSEGRDSAYVSKIVARSQKIVDALKIKKADAAKNVLNIIANRYFELNDIYDARDSKIKAIKADTATYKGKYKDVALREARYEADSKVYRSHFGFPAQLSLYLNEKQIDQVKDGMTFNKVKVTYDAYLDEIPTLKEDEKVQMMIWLKEARDIAIDAESSKMKHEVFNKYKGRINNYLSSHGYDMKKEREAWFKRLEAKKAKDKK